MRRIDRNQRSPEARTDRRSRLAVAVAAGVMAALALPAVAGTLDVRLLLPVKARLDLTDKSSITVAPCLVVNEEGASSVSSQGVDVQHEFERYLARLLRRNTRLKIVESGPVDYPTYEIATLASNQDFWRVLGERVGADLIVLCSLDFDVQDRSGYRTEEYTSPYDGRTYYRQVLVEQTGFEYDIVMQIFDGGSGDQLYSDNFKDFKQFEGERADPLEGMFENLFALEDRIAGIFAQKQVETTRVLFTQ